jgi:hemoglobin-like flavoprotein
MMTKLEIQSIRKSFHLLEGKTDLVATLFYNRLFQFDPSLKMLFRGDMTTQGKKLMDAMLVLNASLDRFPALCPTLQHMGRRHAEYGVRPEHYETVATALLQTLQEFAGPRFDQNLQQAWTRLLGLVSSEMLHGAAQAETMDLSNVAWGRSAPGSESSVSNSD